MTITVTLNDLANLQNENTAVSSINANSNFIEVGFDSALNTAGDQMLGTLDMNSNQIINLPNPATANSPLRLQDLNAFTGSGTVTNIPAGGAVGDVLVKTSASSYVVGWSPNAAGVTAGTNIVLSGTSPVIVGTITSPSFNIVTATTENISTANVITLSVSTVTVAGSLTATGNITGASGNFTNLTVTSAISASTITASTITATTVTATVPAGTLSGTTLASNVVSTSIASVGTITSGTWSATPITATSLSGTTLAGGIVVSSLTTVGAISSLTASTLTASTANISTINANNVTATTGLSVTGTSGLISFYDRNAGGHFGALYRSSEVNVLYDSQFGDTVHWGSSGTVSVLGGLTATSKIAALNGSTTIAGGNTTAGLTLGSLGVGIYFGSGVPSVTAATGSLYLRTDGSGPSTRLYVNTTGVSTWTAVVTLA